MVLNRKKIIFILIICLILVLICMYKENNNYYKNENSVMTSGTPVSSHKVILDAGHRSARSVGAVSSNGVSEESINLSIVLKLQKLLEQSGCTVFLTRSDENGIYDLDKKSLKNKKSSDLKNRVKIANSSDAECFISIHLNKIPQSRYYGWQTFFQKNNEESKKLAFDIQNNLNFSIQKENKREILGLSGKYIMDNIKIPTVIVECGFLSNSDESIQLQKEEYQEKLAWGIYTGIMDYFYNK